ncbi:MAG: ABC transporter ATP-binding protein [Clostridia bacterium]|nr:ABC transporter ATP-binding protein [Clostridia bacterium]
MFPKKKYTLWDCVRVVYRIVPFYAVMRLIFEVIGGLAPALVLVTIADFIDAAIAAATDGASISTVLPEIAAVLGAFSLQWLIDSFSELVNARMNQVFSCRLWTEYIDFIQPIAYRYFENEDQIASMRRLRNQLTQKLREGYFSMLSILRSVVNVLSLLAIIVTTVWWAPILIILLSLPLFYVSQKGGKARDAIEKEAEDISEMEYACNGYLFMRDYVEERMLFGFGKSVIKRWFAAQKKENSLWVRYNLKWCMITGSCGAAILVAAAIISVAMIDPLLAGVLTIGSFVSLVNAAIGMIGAFSWNLSVIVSDLSATREFLKDLTAIAAWERDPAAELPPSAEIPRFESLEFENVVFAYPDVDRTILNGVSFKMEKGKHYAIVGANGAGKTTITKLILGLYGNYEGKILLNGKELREWSYADRKAIFSALLQDFAHFSLTMRENIALGALPNPDSVDFETAVRLSGLTETVAELPSGLDSPLGKLDEGGVDLSGGQWQRVAMARTIAGNRPFCILDEPTAALDPLAESRLYEEFGELAKSKTTIFITHRLGSVHLADEIIVLHDGVVAEQGSFAELEAQNGLFAEMYAAQKSWYE